MFDKNKIMDRLSGPGMVTPSLAEGQPDQMDTVRDIEIITGEILEAKRVGGEAVLTIGRGLIEAKALLSHGEWLPWLNDRVEFSERTAQNFMRLAREWSNPHALADLGARKALQLLALPESEREEFLSGTHTVDGEEKSVVDMTSRELERVIKERDAANKAAEQAKSDAKAAEEARQSMEESLNQANELLDRAKSDMKLANDVAADLEKQLAELKAAPVDVAVMQVDQEQLDKARAEGAAEKEAQLSKLQAKLDKAKAAQKEAEEKQKEAESSVEDMKRQLEEAEKTKEEAVAQERKKVAASDPDMAAFRIYFDQIQETGNKLRGLLIKARKREDQDTAGKLVSALTALGEMLKEAAK